MRGAADKAAGEGGGIGNVGVEGGGGHGVADWKKGRSVAGKFADVVQAVVAFAGVDIQLGVRIPQDGVAFAQAECAAFLPHGVQGVCVYGGFGQQLVKRDGAGGQGNDAYLKRIFRRPIATLNNIWV